VAHVVNDQHLLDPGGGLELVEAGQDPGNPGVVVLLVAVVGQERRQGVDDQHADPVLGQVLGPDLAAGLVQDVEQVELAAEGFDQDPVEVLDALVPEPVPEGAAR
jgi:hypothetical protein